jgi:hypothetical protein
MRNVSDKSCRETQNTRFVFNGFFLLNCFVYEKMWKNIVERGRPQMSIWRMRIAYCIPKATNPHSECVIRMAFPPQQWFHACASMLRHTHIARLVPFLFAVFLQSFCYFVLSLDVLLLSSVSFSFRLTSGAG